MGIFKSIKNFFKGVYKEMKRVRWPKGEVLVKTVATVIVFAIFFGAYLVLTDYTVLQLLQAIGFN